MRRCVIIAVAILTVKLNVSKKSHFIHTRDFQTRFNTMLDARERNNDRDYAYTYISNFKVSLNNASVVSVRHSVEIRALRLIVLFY